MCKIDWNLIIQFFIAIGTCGAVMVALWGEWIKYYLWPLSLRIEPHNTKGVLGGDPDSIYYHLRVVNSRKWRIAKNCRVNLLEIHKQYPNGEFYPIPIVVESSFFWSPRSGSRINYDVNDWKEFDFLISVQNHNVRPLISFYPREFEGNVSPGGKVRYVLQIVAEGFRSERQIFEVAWDGNWTTNLAEMGRHLTIRELV